jgi:hypothetical protein
LRFLLDNNLSIYLAQALNALSKPEGAEVKHLTEQFAPDTPDPIWIEALARAGDWCIVTQDRLRKNTMEREALRRSGVTTFILASGWSSFDQWHKAWLLVRWWPRILQTADLMTGGVFEVPVKFSNRGRFQPVRL